MNGLNVIFSQNEAATIAANTQTLATALAAGHSVIVYLDELNQTDYSKAPTVFESRQALTDYVNRHVPLHLQARLQCHWGATFTTEPTTITPLQPTGHQANGSGLQNHSVSDAYPFIIGFLSPDTNKWYVQDPQGNRLPERYDTHQQAEEKIRQLKSVL